MISSALLLFSLLPPHADRDNASAAAPQASSVEMVRYVNENARRIKSLTFTSVSLRVSQDDNIGTVEGRLDCQRPRNFRLTGKAADLPAVDLGSNGKEFWYWISKAHPPYVYHCS